MNEQKLEELVEQAITQNESGWPDFRKALTGSGSLYLHVFAEEFAGLIVKECVDRIKNADMTDLEGSDPDDVLWLVERQIVKHFGVKE